MSAPPVRIESKAWTDTRYTTLALELGLQPGDADVALIRCAAIWRWQTEHYTASAPTYVVDRSVVIGALKSLRGADAMVAAGLAELQADGRLRIKGGIDDKGRSRIDWLWRDRQAQAEKGRRRAERAAADGRNAGRFASQQATSRAPAALQPEGVKEPAGDQPATSSPDSGLSSPSDLSVSPAREVEPVVVQPVQIGQLIADARVRLDQERRRIDPTAPTLPPMAGERALRDRLAELQPAERAPVLAHCIAVLVAEAERAGSINNLHFGWLAGPNAWAALRAKTVAGVRGRDSPTGRSRTGGAAVGRAQPATDHTSTEAIDPKDITP